MSIVRNILYSTLVVLLGTMGVTSCSESNDTWDPYYNWQERNAQWYDEIADSARTAIAEAKTLYGEDGWEEHCDWRMYKTLLKSQDVNTGKTTDSICVHIVNRGTGDYSPTYSDTVRVSFRGWLMNTQYVDDEQNKYEEMSVFTQTYYGPFDASTAAPSLLGVNKNIDGYATALQYMVQGDDWMVYIPQTLAYGSDAKGTIPAYSTLLFRIHLAAVYPVNSGIPGWKVRGK